MHRTASSESALDKLRPAGAWILSSLGDHQLLFSEADQAVYEVDDLTAHVCSSLERGLSPRLIIDELVDAGLAAGHAKAAVTERLRQLGAVDGHPTALQTAVRLEPAERLMPLVLEIAGVAVQLHLSEMLLPDVEAVFGHLKSGVPTTQAQLCARVAGERVEFLLPGQPKWSCARAEFVPLLKAQLIEAVLRCARYEVALHAAALERQGQALLLVGSPGAGKTTLAIALSRIGFNVAGDDVLLLDAAGCVTGLPFRFTAKAGSWPLIAEHWPGLIGGPSHERPDGQTVRYLPLEPAAGAGPLDVGSVVLLDRRDDAVAHLQEIDRAVALAALVAEGAARDERLSAAGFSALVDALNAAHCYRLSYCDLLEAAAALRGRDR